VERAFVHVDYEHEHDTHEEHKPLYDKQEPKVPLSRRIKEKFSKKSAAENS
jgi:hypothetical protein